MSDIFRQSSTVEEEEEEEEDEEEEEEEEDEEEEDEEEEDEEEDEEDEEKDWFVFNDTVEVLRDPRRLRLSRGASLQPDESVYIIVLLVRALAGKKGKGL